MTIENAACDARQTQDDAGAKTAGAAGATLSLFAPGSLPFAPSPALVATAQRSAPLPEQRGVIGQLATAYGVGTKTEENGAMAEQHFARYPSDRLLPMPAPDAIHPDWPAEEIADIVKMSERLARAGDASTANLWRSLLEEPRRSAFFNAATRGRLVRSAERRAAIRAGLPVDPGLTFKLTSPDLASVRPEPTTQACGRGKRRVRLSAGLLSLAALMRAGHAVVSVHWSNPYTQPPCGLPRTVWQVAVPFGTDTKAVLEACGPDFEIGSGWTVGISIQTPPGAKWSDEAKGRVRRRNLKTRLDKKVPLLADLLYQEQLAHRPDYFAGKPLRAEPVAPTAQEVTAPADEASSLLGHNGGPALDPLE
ncbi:hypothetical protein [Azospirillum sp. sgz302134]